MRSAVAIGGIALAGMGMITFSSTCQTVVQSLVTDELRGRVMGVWQLVFAGSLPLGGLLEGYVAKNWGAPTAILDASAVTEIRTAAVTAVATGLLARTDARTLAVLGAGVQGRAHLTSLAGVRAALAAIRVVPRPAARHGTQLLVHAVVSLAG